MKNVCELCDEMLEKKDTEAIDYCDLCNDEKGKEKRLKSSCSWC
jgi:hypothetical protein